MAPITHCVVNAARIEIPYFVTSTDGDWYSVRYHAETPKRKWRTAHLSTIMHDVGDDTVHDFLAFCKSRDNFYEVWRLPGCDAGCFHCWDIRWMQMSMPLERDERLSPGDRCARDWWCVVDKDSTTDEPVPNEPDTFAILHAVPFTDFHIVPV